MGVDKPIPTPIIISVFSGAFGICCLGFMLLHGMVVADRAYAADQLARAVESRTSQMNRMADMFEAYRNANERDHKEIMAVLVKISREIK